MIIKNEIYDKVLADEGGFVLHKNKGEDDFTFGGLYKKYNKKWAYWPVVENVYKRKGQAKSMDFYPKLRLEIKNSWRVYVWDKYGKIAGCGKKLSDAKNYIILSIAFLQDPYDAARIVQKAVGVKVDGVIGPNSLKKIKAMNDKNFFNATYYYFWEKVLKRDKKSFYCFYKGWQNRWGRIRQSISL